MREFFPGMKIDAGRSKKRKSYAERHALAVIVAALAVSMLVIGALAMSTSQRRNDGQGAHINWTTDTVDSFGDVGQYCSLAVDPSGSHPEISYYNASTGDFKMANWNGLSWNSTTHFAANDVGKFTSLVINGSVTYVCFYDATNGDLIYGNSLYAGEWVDTYGDVGQYASMAINPATGTLAISYYNASSSDLKVAINRSGAGWVNTTVDSGGDVGLYSNLVFLGTNDTISILYYDATNGDLKNAWQWGGASTWTSMAIDGSGVDVGKWPSQWSSANGSDWWGSYYDVTNGNLLVQAWLNGGKIMGTALPDIIGNVGQYTSLAVNSTGTAFVSYYDVTNGDLKLAWNTTDAATWSNVTLDSVGDVGKYTSMKIDSNNVIHIAYYDATNGDLKYIRASTSEFIIPEFGDIVLPIIGTMALIAVIAATRDRKDS